MSIIVGHSVPGAVLGNAAEHAAAAVARRENVLKSLQAAQEQQQFAANMAQQQAHAQQQAYQFEANRQDQGFAQMMDAYNRALQHKEAMARQKMAQDQAAQEQMNFDAKHQLDRQQFDYQQKDAAQRNQTYTDRQALDEQQYLGKIQGEMKTRVAAGINGNLIGDGQQSFRSWKKSLDSLNDEYRKGTMTRMQYIGKLNEHAAHYDSLGLDMYHKPPLSPQEQYDKEKVMINGVEHYPVRNAAGHITEYKRPEVEKVNYVPFKVDQKTIQAAREKVATDKAMSLVGKPNPSRPGENYTVDEAQRQVGQPTPAEVDALINQWKSDYERYNPPPAPKQQTPPIRVPGHDPLPPGVTVYTGDQSRQATAQPAPEPQRSVAPAAPRPPQYYPATHSPSRQVPEGIKILRKKFAEDWISSGDPEREQIASVYMDGTHDHYWHDVEGFRSAVNVLVSKDKIKGTQEDPIPVLDPKDAEKYPGKVVVLPDGRLKRYTKD